MEPTAPQVAPMSVADAPRAAPPQARPTRLTLVFPPRTHRVAEALVFLAAAALLLIVLPALNAAGRPAEAVPAAWYWISDVQLNLLGRYLSYAVLALGLDLIWGYTGILSLCHALFFCLGGYCMGMYLSLQTGA